MSGNICDTNPSKMGGGVKGTYDGLVLQLKDPGCDVDLEIIAS